MILSELRTPFIENPYVEDTLCGYDRATERRDITFYLSAERFTARKRVHDLLHRTGEEISRDIIPEKPDLCGACHELRDTVCTSASTCIKSFLNPHCLHADYAGINPYLDSILFILYCGGSVQEETFLHASAILRLLGQRKHAADLLAGPTEQDLFLESRYMEIFGRDNPYLTREEFTTGILAGSDDSRLRRNILIQRAFEDMVRPLFKELTEIIQRGMNAKMTQEKRDESFFTGIRDKIRARMAVISPTFWQITSISGSNT